MKNNGPVTGREQHFKPGEKLISSTDLQGVIQHCNSEFEKISGFSREELIGAHHNILRHPDMPREAFEVLWSNLKAGRPWMGMIKNRCKNGDHYWVSAYVTPVTEKGKVVGYESVRSCPDRKDVDRAEKLYQQLNAKRRKFVVPGFAKQLLVAVVFILPALGLGIWHSAFASSLWLSAAILMLGGVQYYQHQRDLDLIKSELHGVFMHTLAVQTYTNKHDLSGELMVGIMSLRAHLDAVLTRIEDASVRVAEQSRIGLEHSERARVGIAEQTRQTDLVATAMSEMSRAIHEISQHVQETASHAEESSQLADNGQRIAETTRKSIEELKNTVTGIGSAVQALANQTQEIAKAASSIETISEQTNLLALNAAIEAARAGEHGRGFSIVADEVRVLAANTKDSAQNIGRIVGSLTGQAEQSVHIANAGAQDAETGLQKVIESETMLRGIAEALLHISSMSEQMAAAVEEQAHVSEEVNGQIREISELALNSLNRTEESASNIRISQEVSEELYELVNRFKQ